MVTFTKAAALMQKEAIHLTGVKQTLLVTLYARAMESRSANPILRDPSAEDVLERLDYPLGALKLAKDDQLRFVMRAKLLDTWTAEFLAANPGATVLSLGCGLDGRIQRVNPPSSINWYDLDYPDVIALRQHFFQERLGYQMIASSVTDPAWLNAVPRGRAMVIAEGLRMYLSEDEVRELLGRMIDHFSGGLLAFDALIPMAVRIAKYLPAVPKIWAVRWGLDAPRLIEQWYPRLEFIAETMILESPWIDKLPWLTRLALKAANRVPALRRMHRLLRYRF